MDIHYNAFISYRHHPDDIRVAEQIHKGLEHFRIPKAIKRKNSGPMRLFRDKEELPITSHLTDDIGRALKNSEFLIVICSPHTKESVWVQREIETFLKSHSRDRILTVLAAGEPYDVIPEILLYEDVLNPVTGQIQREEIEPLSCDWRMKKKKATREELPRLAAPLLGCAYDELRQRQRQYRMRRMVAAFSAALVASLGLTAYFVNTSIQIQKANEDLQAANQQILDANVQIQENLDQALQNQSEYLAAAAEERMEAGDRLTAIALALAALPDEENERPYLPEAEQALTTAISSYQSAETISAMGAFPADGVVEQFLVTDDGKILYMKDARSVVTVWNTDTFGKLATIDHGSGMLDTMYLTPAGNVVITTKSILDGELFCYQPDGTLLWELENCSDLAFLDDRSEILLRIDEDDGTDWIMCVNSDTGENTRQPIAVPQNDEMDLFMGFLMMENQSDMQIPLKYRQGDDTVIWLLDLSAGKFRELTRMDTSFSGDNYNIDCIGQDHHGNLLLMRGDGSGDMNGNYFGVELTGPDRADLICYDSQTLQVKWQSEITTYIYSSHRTIAPIPDREQILVQNGNTFQLHDARTGECLASSQTAAIPLFVRVEQEIAWGLLDNGTYFEFEYASARCRTSSFADTQLTGAVANKGYYVHTPLSYQVTLYRSVKDDMALPYDGQLSNSASMCLTKDDCMMVIAGSYLHMLDARQNRILWKEELGYNWKPIGFSPDGAKLWLWSTADGAIFSFAADTGERTRIEIPMQMEEGYTRLASDFLQAGETVFYALESDSQVRLYQVDMNTGETRNCWEMETPEKEATGFFENIHLMKLWDNKLWLYCDQTVQTINLENGISYKVYTDVAQVPCCTRMENDGNILVGAGNQMLLTKPDGRIIRRIDLGDLKAVSVYGYDNQMLVLADDGAIYRYGRQGQQLSKITLNLYDSFYGNVTYGDDNPMGLFWCETDDGNLILNAFGAGNIIDCSQWQTRAFIPQLQAYFPELDTFVCTATEDVFGYKRYTTDQQIQKAKEALGDYRLTPQLKKYYGLS